MDTLFCPKCGNPVRLEKGPTRKKGKKHVMILEGKCEECGELVEKEVPLD